MGPRAQPAVLRADGDLAWAPGSPQPALGQQTALGMSEEQSY